MVYGEINGLSFDTYDKHAVCHIDFFSDQFKEIIRVHLTAICSGRALAKEFPQAYNYKETLKNFLKRFDSKTIDTQKGMIGELLTHILMIELYPKFEHISPYFNMEEKSIRKGFDILLYEKSLNEVWVTEVKSGELHENKCSNQTTMTLLNKAFSDLKKRLNEQESAYWSNAINSARVAIEDQDDCKITIQNILAGEVILTNEDKANSLDNNVILVSVLFEDLTNRFDKKIPENFSNKKNLQGHFKKLIVLSIQKETYEKVADFFRSELIC